VCVYNETLPLSCEVFRVSNGIKSTNNTVLLLYYKLSRVCAYSSRSTAAAALVD
jgi:hypothetical protein